LKPSKTPFLPRHIIGLCQIPSSARNSDLLLADLIVDDLLSEAAMGFLSGARVNEMQVM
jgi:hypothetical protein